VCLDMFGHVCEGSYMFVCVCEGRRASSSVLLTVDCGVPCEFVEIDNKLTSVLQS
jgi:hypothetical protein